MVKFSVLQVSLLKSSSRKLTKVFNSNLSWLLLEKTVRIILGLIFGGFVARKLGPTNYGGLNYAYSLSAIFLPLSTLGIETLIMKKVSEEPNKINFHISLLMKTKFIGYLIYLSLLISTSLLVTEVKIMHLVLLLSVTQGIIIFESLDLFFQYNSNAKYLARLKLTLFVVFTFLKLYVINLFPYPIMVLLLGLFETLLIAIVLINKYREKNMLLFVKVAKMDVVSLIGESWYLIASNVAVMIYMRIDQVLIGNILTLEELGFYSVAVKMSEIFFFIPSLVMTIAYPKILKLINSSLKRELIEELYKAIILLGLFLSLFVFLFSNHIIQILFGSTYTQSILLLKINIVVLLFVFIGVINNQLLVAEGKGIYVLYSMLIGTVINIVINILFLKKYGVNVAAISTVISYCVASCFGLLIFKRTRQNFLIIYSSLLNIFKPKLSLWAHFLD